MRRDSKKRCFTSAPESPAQYGSIRERLVKHFACAISTISPNGPNVRYWPFADIAIALMNVRY